MSQLNGDGLPPDSGSDRTDADSPRSFHPARRAGPVQTLQEHQSDEAVLFVSPPPLPWPRIFPPL
jgi:hypothetical protein